MTVVAADTWYGRDDHFRDHVTARDTVAMVRIPCHQEVSLEELRIGIPEKAAGQRGPACTHYIKEKLLCVTHNQDLIRYSDAVWYVG